MKSTFVVAAAVALMSGVAGCGTENSDEGSTDETRTSAAESTETGTTQDPEEEAAVDLSTFTAVDEPAWAQIAKDPDGSKGDRVIVFAEVTQFDSATGTGALRANVGATQPAGEYELETNAIVVGTDEMLADVTMGDVLRVHAEVTGSLQYETTIGGKMDAPELTAAAIEVVGFLDLTGDAVLGEAVWDEYGGVEVPVTVTNSGSDQMDYSIDVVVESSDGSMQLGSATAYVENLQPGQSGLAQASFYDDIPNDAVFRVASVERYNF